MTIVSDLSAHYRLMQSLLGPAPYPHPVAGAIDVVETHISFVLLTGEFAYKLKKPVDLGFADFRSLERRRFYCDEEARLNRRLAERLYLGTVPIAGTVGAPRVGGSGPPIEWAVKMRQFPRGAELDRAIARGESCAEAIDRLAIDVARFHAALPPSPESSAHGTPERVMAQVEDVFARFLPRIGGRPFAGDVAAIRAAVRREEARLRGVFAERKRAGFVRECHGDLHARNVALLEDGPVAFDALEFDADLRTTDVTSDVAFLVMDLEERSRADLGRRFLDGWLARTGDFAGLAVLRHGVVYRALVRAMVETIRGSQAGGEAARAADAAAARYVAIARRWTEPFPRRLTITHGFSGSGKTTASGRLVERTDGVRVRSDVERKRLFGLAPDARTDSPIDSGIYSAAATAATFERLAGIAETILDAGFPAIVDAAFLKRSERDRFRAIAERRGLPFAILACEAPVETLRERIRARAAAGRDASEADLAVLARQLATADPLTPAEKSCQAPFPA